MYVATEFSPRERDSLEQRQAETPSRGVVWGSVFVSIGFWLPAALVFSLARAD